MSADAYVLVTQSIGGVVTCALYLDDTYVSSLFAASVSTINVVFTYSTGGQICTMPNAAVLAPYVPCPTDMAGTRCMAVSCTGTYPSANGTYTIEGEFTKCPSSNPSCGSTTSVLSNAIALTAGTGGPIVASGSVNTNVSAGSSGNGPSIGMIAGISVGVVAVLAGLGVWWFRRRKSRPYDKRSLSDSLQQPDPSSQDYTRTAVPARVDLPVSQPRAEPKFNYNPASAPAFVPQQGQDNSVGSVQGLNYDPANAPMRSGTKQQSQRSQNQQGTDSQSQLQAANRSARSQSATGRSAIRTNVSEGPLVETAAVSGPYFATATAIPITAINQSINLEPVENFSVVPLGPVNSTAFQPNPYMSSDINGNRYMANSDIGRMQIAQQQGSFTPSQSNQYSANVQGNMQYSANAQGNMQYSANAQSNFVGIPSNPYMVPSSDFGRLPTNPSSGNIQVLQPNSYIAEGNPVGNGFPSPRKPTENPVAPGQNFVSPSYMGMGSHNETVNTAGTREVHGAAIMHTYPPPQQLQPQLPVGVEYPGPHSRQNFSSNQ
ncbi:hypothetical protein HDU83_000843 [Entophlyctis luteolus]|nr:hypothetical protein HDU83_000843 [Entophlyctis luteolus]KAJ3389080.1 hypothetical protein HDU84_009175 [Entophlyctis sp. JEL0112]